MSFRKKLKMLTIDNVIAMILSFAAYIGGALALSEQFIPQLRVLWFILFFAGFIVFMYNVVALMDLKHLGYHIQRDIKDLSDGKIDGKQNGKPLD